ncbi:MAG: flagellar biosynthetic protein FlhB [Planctomycetaceae bacterium]|nr:MAG: flagellar biosynthetic protein FlhB [Planctomycetaceae bacterium]
MSTDEFGEKTEQPTERRRQQARQQGHIARSTDLSAAGLFLAVTLAWSFWGSTCWHALLDYTHRSLQEVTYTPLDVPSSFRMFQTAAWRMAGIVLPMLGLILACVLTVNLLQTGFLWAPEVLVPRWERLNPLTGWQRIFSWVGLMRLAGSLVKIVSVAAVAAAYCWWSLPQWLEMCQLPLEQIVPVAGNAMRMLAIYVSCTLLVWATIDYGFQYWNYERELRMTKQELREELKEMDGNPLVRARRREAYRKLLEVRQLGDVKHADVVITNPTEIAVAVKYDPETMVAPTVVAKGAGEIAAQIRKLAALHGVPIIERKPLAQALYKQVKVGQPIPVEMYEVFVEILAYVYRITGKKPRLPGVT